MIRYSDAVSVASQVMQDMFRPAKGRLGIDNPVLSRQGIQERIKGRFVGQSFAFSVKRQSVVLEGFAQSIDELTAKDFAKHLHRQQEFIP